MKHFRKALIFGIIIGIGAVVFLASPLGHYIEDEFGLALLFKTRGALPAPSDVVIINLDEKSSAQLDLPQKIENWPRSVYADLVTVLSDLGAAVIVFDVHFGDAQIQANDRRFAEEMETAGNVILYQKMVRKFTGPSSDPAMAAVVDIEQEIPPIKIFADAALASASFPIPKMPVRVNQAWTFKTSAGDIPTLPVIAMQALTLDRYEDFYGYVKNSTGSSMKGIPETWRQVTEQAGLIETMRRYKQLLFTDSAIPPPQPSPPHASKNDQENDRVYEALMNTYRDANNIYINFYGPPATLKTFSLTDLLSAYRADSESMRNILEHKVVFVGAARTSWSEQKDGFYTVFTQSNGLDLSGVEIAATVFANLLDGTHLKSPKVSILAALLIGSALIFSFISFSFNPTGAAAALIGLTGVSFFAATQLFTMHAIRLPVITWLILLPPLLFFSAIIFKFIRVRRERTHIKEALHLYLPDNVVEEITNDLSFIKTGDRMVYGVCLTTDAQNYTTLSEKLEPTELSSLMKNYFEMMFKAVNGYGGVVCNVIGDSMFSMWPSTDPEIAGKKNACLASIDIIRTIDAFNERHPEQALPTRIGLHSGYLLMGNIGAEGHYEYAPVGDIVNTASRIENVNKKLGTSILASEETVQDCDGLDARLMGTFLMSGKSRPVTLYQILPHATGSADKRRLYDDAFPAALALFRSGQLGKAEAAFRKCLEMQVDDGPSRFYLNLCGQYRDNPPDLDWKGVISLQK